MKGSKIKFFLVSFLVLSFSFGFSFSGDSSFLLRRLRSVPVGYLPSSGIEVVDALDGMVKVEMILPQTFEENPALVPTLSAFFRALSYNRDIEISAIVSPVSAEELARAIQSNYALGPWRGVNVSAEGNTLIIRGMDTEVRIPVSTSSTRSTGGADVSICLGDVSRAPSILSGKRALYFPVGSITTQEGITALPGSIGEWDSAVVNVSELTGLAIALQALREELGGFGMVGRIDVFCPEGDMTIVPSAKEADVSDYLSSLGITSPGMRVTLHTTKISGDIKGARLVGIVITFPSKVTKEDLIKIFEAHPLLGVAPEKDSTSAMFTNPYETKLFYLNTGKTVVDELKDGSTMITLRGWVGDYSYAGMMISAITEVGQRLSELGILSTQKASVIYPAVEHPKVQVLAQPKRVMVNGGGGRIGVNILRSLIGDPNFDVVAVNGVRSAEALRQGLLYDEILGPTRAVIETGKQKLLDGREIEFVTINGHKIYVFNAREDEEVRQLPLGDLGIEYVLEASGNYTQTKDFEPFFQAGAKYGFISAPAKDKTTPEIVPGVNPETFVAMAREGLSQVVSFGSCTTNNAAPAIRAVLDLLEARGLQVEEQLEKVTLETVHAVTQTQAHLLPIQIRDPNKEPERARAGALNIVVSSTGAAKVIPKIIEEIDKMEGIALRVGNPNGSESQISFYLDGKSPVTKEEIVAYLQERARTDLFNILRVNTGEKLDSLAINGSDITSIVEASTVKVTPRYNDKGEYVGDMIVLNTWYDNEWSYTQQYLRGIIMFTLLLENPGLTPEELLVRSDRLGVHAYAPIP
ncbi:MAG: hypothetical protein NC818_00220 [Candidatus Omnitrophica bacterium]|nr:hypothetical protein [Candidatus Omnitrophota bacterium]